MLDTAVIGILLMGLAGVSAYAWTLRQQLFKQKLQPDVEKLDTLQSLKEMDQQLLDVKKLLEARTDEVTRLQKDLGTAEGVLLEFRQVNEEKEKQISALKEKESQLQAQNTAVEITLHEIRQQHDDLEKQHGHERALMLTLSNAAFDALMIVNEDFKIIASNTSAERLFEADQLVGKLLVDATNKPELQMMVEDALVNEEASYEEQMTIGEFHYRIQAQVIRRDGNLFIALALQDITRLVKLNRARRDMVANISHELRTPIANIRLIIDGLFHDQDKPKRKDSISSLRSIARETDHLLWLVQEMSDLSMIESGQAIVRMVEVPLVELIDEAIERMDDQSEERKIKIVSHVPEKLRVLCDRDLAQRVLVNLIHNALKWSPPNNAITVSASNGGDEVVISVLDNGPGVPEDSVERIFERFYQVDASRSGGEGTGLGLAICRHIVEAHGGRVWAESNKDGSGGRFRFTLLSAGEPKASETIQQQMS